MNKDVKKKNDEQIAKDVQNVMAVQNVTDRTKYPIY